MYMFRVIKMINKYPAMIDAIQVKESIHFTIRQGYTFLEKSCIPKQETINLIIHFFSFGCLMHNYAFLFNINYYHEVNVTGVPSAQNISWYLPEYPRNLRP